MRCQKVFSSRKRILSAQRNSVPFHWPAFLLFHAVLTAHDWQSGRDFRTAQLPVSILGKSGFTRLPSSQTGISFTNHLSDNTAAQNQIRLNGSGVALGDVDEIGRAS